jgi:ABC-2 type transport system permease protein
MLRRIWAVMQKEFVQTFRDRSTLLIQLTTPFLLLFLFGYAISMNIEDIPVIVADQGLDEASHAYVDAMVVSGYFDIVGYARSEADVIRAIDAGEARMGIVIPPDFATRVERGDAQVLILVDGSDLFTSQSAYNAATNIAEAHSAELLIEKVERAGLLPQGQSLMPLDARVRILYNPNLEDLWFIVPSLVAMLLQIQAMSLTAASVVRERETGTIEQILVTPIRSGELMLGKMAPNVIIALVNIISIVAIGVFWFGVPFQGSFWLFLGLAFVYIFSGLGLGLLISTVSQNQKQAQQIILIVMLLGVILGGFIFPRYAMPALIQGVSYLFPLTYFIPISRGIISKGIGITFLWQNVIALLIYIVVILFAASRLFRQRLD